MTNSTGRAGDDGIRRRRPILVRIASEGEREDVAALVVRVQPGVTVVWYNARLLPQHRAQLMAWVEAQRVLGTRSVSALRIEALAG